MLAHRMFPLFDFPTGVLANVMLSNKLLNLLRLNFLEHTNKEEFPGSALFSFNASALQTSHKNVAA